MARSTVAPHCKVVQAQALLALAEGTSVRSTAAAVGSYPNTVTRWRDRCLTAGVAGVGVIYTAPTVSAAEARFAEFTETWRERYPAMIDTWQRAWGEFVPVLDFPFELRTIVYTTNAIESLNARFRKAVRHRGHFPNKQAALNVLYLVTIERRPNRSNPTGKINAWKKILNTLTIHYGDRIAATN